MMKTVGQIAGSLVIRIAKSSVVAPLRNSYIGHEILQPVTKVYGPFPKAKSCSSVYLYLNEKSVLLSHNT